ncbi:uncharacterized protein LOC121745791 [Salvia splendens]|uniref:uncharacterized protein LOC121745791 n=1 Tax=Salvia splendens TaxID=180675 RepID=UPI001C2574B7|nr:uncharacterized protein LOC121745791 [Salvia splendens]
MRHTKARNIIERAFAVMKMRWGILRSSSFYPIDVQTNLINACFLLHNFIRGQMEIDPLEVQMDSQGDDGSRSDPDDDRVDFIQSIEPTTAWAKKREDLAAEMWLDFNA